MTGPHPPIRAAPRQLAAHFAAYNSAVHVIANHLADLPPTRPGSVASPTP